MAKNRKIWTTEEVGILNDLRSQGVSVSEIANKLGRSFLSVECKLSEKRRNEWRRNRNKPVITEDTPKQIKRTHTPKRLSEFVLSIPYVRPKFFKPESIILGVGDFHAPYHHKSYFDFLWQTYQKYKCTGVIFAGDFVDQYRHSRYETNPSAISAEEEYELALESLKVLYKIFPNAKVCLGNHDNRYMKMASKGGLIRAQVMDIPQLYQFPKTWELSERFVVDGVYYEHGEVFKSLRDVAYNSFYSIAFGHLHSEFGVQYVLKPNQPQRFALGLGCGVDRSAVAFDYAKFARNSAVLGCGVTINGREAFPVKML